MRSRAVRTSSVHDAFEAMDQQLDERLEGLVERQGEAEATPDLEESRDAVSVGT